MCEKPLTPTAAEAEELFKIAKANKRILGVYQNRRWDGDFLTIQKLIKDGTVSRPLACQDRAGTDADDSSDRLSTSHLALTATSPHRHLPISGRSERASTTMRFTTWART